MTGMRLRFALTVIAGCAVAVMASCDRAPRRATEGTAACAMTRSDTLALATLARDTIARLKGKPQVVTLISAIKSGVSIRTEDSDSTAFHNGGAVSFDCGRRVTSVWLDAG